MGGWLYGGGVLCVFGSFVICGCIFLFVSGMVICNCYIFGVCVD